MTVQEIIDTLTPNSNHFPREALAAAVEHKEELIPHLLDSLDYVCDSADEIMEKDLSYDLYFYAMYLLAQFREKQAFPKLVRLLRLDDEALEYFLGDVVTEGGSRCLHSVYDGNLGLLKELIEGTNVSEYVRNAALEAYGFTTRGDPAAREEMIAYLRRYIHEHVKDDTATLMPTFVSSVVIDEHFFELIPDIKLLYDRNLIDLFFHGGYDGFIDFIFSYRNEDKNIFIDDVIRELHRWAKYNQEPVPKPKPELKLPLEKYTAGGSSQRTSKKIGRNDPCPCASGKKYKKCCLPLDSARPIIPDEKYEEDEDEEYLSEDTEALRALFSGMHDESKPYDLMKNYPDRGPASGEGQRTITEFYSPKAIEVDIPVYKALCHRSIPIWVKRNTAREDLGRIDFLLEAFALFSKICEEERLETFADYDRKYMVHYESAVWVDALNKLLGKYTNAISEKKRAVHRAVNDALTRMGATQP